MKTYLQIIYIPILLLCCACEQSETPSSGHSKSSFVLDAAFDNKVYELGETFEVALSIEERFAAAEFCHLQVNGIAGRATITLDGAAVELGVPKIVNYAVSNDASSTQMLVFEITPAAATAVDQTLKVEFTVMSADKQVSTTKTIEVQATNTSPITVNATYSGEPFTSDQTLDIALDVQKSGYTGDLTIALSHSEGEGFCILGEVNIKDGDSFVARVDQSPITLKYKPFTQGKHTFTLTISDGQLSSIATIVCEVYNEDGLTYPEKDGAYIYAKNFSGSPFFTAKEWAQSDKSLEIEGIAFFLSGTRILLPLHACEPLVFCGKEDDLTKIPGVSLPMGSDGKINTELIYNAYKSGLLSSAPIVEACYNYEPTHPGRWYLPSANQLAQLKFNIYIGWIRDCMQAAGGTLLMENADYASSSVKEATYIHSYRFFTFELSNGDCGQLFWSYVATPITYFPIRNL